MEKEGKTGKKQAKDRADNLPIETRFKKGQSGNPNGRPKGVKNRSTIARKILEMTGALPEELISNLKKMFPEVKNNMTIEEIMTLKMTSKAITRGDVNAYKAVMDSGYGRPEQALTGKDGAPLIRQNPFDEMSEEDLDSEIQKIIERNNG